MWDVVYEGGFKLVNLQWKNDAGSRGSKEAGRNDVAVFDFENSDNAYICFCFRPYV